MVYFEDTRDQGKITNSSLSTICDHAGPLNGQSGDGQWGRLNIQRYWTTFVRPLG